MITFMQMQHLMNDNVLQAVGWLLYELKIQPDTMSPNITGAPFGFHLPHAPLGNRYVYYGLPFINK